MTTTSGTVTITFLTETVSETSTVSSTVSDTATSTFIAADYTTEPDFQGWYLQATRSFSSNYTGLESSH
ncbi:hypothetical protein N7495_003723 [Penicillium taxi]|uniref:uncharacterized protein n=1 Tax=Penicillium taxi TaxID=168475 RepID=UPI002544F766|nr:uncharacterized protein N7495_003723 [Penicillium taxi]KAJ5898979.1 hypothetical protein N7495_003723 [Penicillium taxi]